MPASAHEVTPVSATPVRSDSDARAVKIVPKGLRSFDRHDASFFLELLPGPRDRDGLPESLRFWKTRIESTDPDATFRVGLIYGPSGCGKSSLVKAGLLPRLDKDVLAAYVEATPEETEPRMLRGLRKACPELGGGLDLVDALAALRRGRVLRPGQKVLLVLDQFEQWLFARRNEPDPELVAALRQCDGDHVQAVIMVRDDFWMAATRFMRDLEIRIVEGENSAAVDLFDPMHARRVLAAFGRAYGVLPETSSELTPDQKAFLEQSVAGLAHDGKVISVRLALFAEMVKGKPWSTSTLRDVGGARGIGVTFLDETFSAATAPPEHRLHQRAAQAVLKALLPGTGADIKGQMRSESELRDASGYAARPRDFEDLIVILDRELRLITPTDPEGSVSESQSGGGDAHRFYQLTHDYLVPSLREWLTRKQRETRRGRAELRLAERAAIWESRPETRHLPSVSEWINIRALTRPKDWTEPQRQMMRRAGRAHGLRALAVAIGVVGLGIAGLEVWNRVSAERRSAAAAKRAVADERRRTAMERVKNLLTADTSDVPALIADIAGNALADAELKRVLMDPAVTEKAKLHARLARLAADPAQVEYLQDCLAKASPDEVSVLRDSLGPHHADLTPKLWPQLESTKTGDPGLLPVASALALYNPDHAHWPDHGDQLAEALVKAAPDSLRGWLRMLRPVRRHLTAPLARIFRDKGRPEAERDAATASLVDYADGELDLLAGLLMDADPKAYTSLFEVVEKQADKVSPRLRAELETKPPDLAWKDRPLDPSWTRPDRSLMDAIRSAQGLFDEHERFAFCQTMPLTEFERVAKGLRTSGYRPVRLRPYDDGSSVRVAAVWRRDGRDWQMEPSLSAEDLRREDGKYAGEKLIPVDVAGYVTKGQDGKLVDRYAALWVKAGDGDEARMYVGEKPDVEAATRDELTDQEYSPSTLQILDLPDGTARTSSVWVRPAQNGSESQADRGLVEGQFAAARAKRSDKVLIDVAVSEATHPQPWRERVKAISDLAEKTLRRKPGNPDALRSQARARLRLGDAAGALGDLNKLIGAGSDDADVLLDRAIAQARLGKKKEARDDLARFERAYTSDGSKLSAAVMVAAELGDQDEADKAVKVLEAAIAKHPDDPDLHLDAALAFALASKRRPLADRSVQLLRDAVRLGFADLRRMDDEPALDPIRDHPDFVKLRSEAHADRRYAAVWSSRSDVENRAIEGLDPAKQLEQARKLMSEGYRPVAWSVAESTPEGPPVTASVWHRPVVSEDAKDELARRQARAAVALVRLGKGEHVWPLLEHGDDPRVRSFIINWLRPLKADPKLVVAEAKGALFDREPSIRRALILALGKYGVDELPAGNREPLVGRLRELYRTDPDAGVHGAAEWTLRRWNVKLEPLDADPPGPGGRGRKHWLVNKHGQTFTVIDGPVEFRVGSPAAEPDRTAEGEAPRQMSLPRSFAIATKEVTLGQFQEFLRQNDQYNKVPPSQIKRYTSVPDGPWVSADWYTAAAYCNWLSRQEGLPEDQWCYHPNDSGVIGEGMRIPADALERTGYRLPTEAEWEYACRAGAITSRYYGMSAGLLGEYAWHSNQERAQPCGTRLPNDLGLFDMLGNVFEWCLDRDGAIRPSRRGVYSDTLITAEVVMNRPNRVLRGGMFSSQSMDVRSAIRTPDVPSLQSGYVGFRLARTLNPGP
jgi:formylglycine-generating enzyme required for sulfatase activity/tetratricopeptide (TPR) repeat protein